MARRMMTGVLALLVAGGFAAAVVAAQPAQALSSCQSYSSQTVHQNVWPTDYMTAWPTAGYQDRGDCRLGVGNTGVGVSVLQESLRNCYARSIPVDGFFGSGTRDALMAVQGGIGVVPDGVYGMATRNSMRWLSDAGSCEYLDQG